MKDKRVFGRLLIRRPEAGEDLFGVGVWVPPAPTGDVVARINECAQWALAFFVGEVRCERFVVGINLGPIADTLGGVVIV